MALTEELKALLRDTANRLKGHGRRVFMAQVVKLLGIRSVQKSRPQKKIPETDDIFEQLHKLHAEANEDEAILRVSMDTKATVLIGLLTRGGKTRVVVRALDHDTEPDEKLTPFGIFLPQYDELYLYLAKSRVTSDFMVNCLCDFWSTVRERFPSPDPTGQSRQWQGKPQPSHAVYEQDH